MVKPESDGDTRAVEEYKFALRVFPNLKLRQVEDEAVARAVPNRPGARK